MSEELNQTMENAESEGKMDTTEQKQLTPEELFPGVDMQIDCADCGNQFLFSANEQEFYREKGFQNRPKRCPDCRHKKVGDRSASRQLYTAICADCGGEAKVPFEPREDRPVRCSSCFEAYRNKI